MVVAAGTGIVPAAAYSTPGGINSFMFAAVPGGNAAAAQTGARNIPGAAAAGDGVFAFQNLAGDVGSVHCVLDPLGQQDLQHQDVGLQQPWQLEADALGGSGGGAGNGDGLQNSDNGSFVVGNNRVVAVQQAARQLGWLSRPGALHTPPAAPHSTPMGPAQAGLTPVGMQQQQTPASSAGSQMRLQVRKQQMQQLRAALREGLSSMLVPAAEGAAVQKPVVAAATAGDATDRTVNRGAETGVPQPYSARQDAAAGGAAAAAGDNGAAAPRAAGMQLPVNASGRHSIVSQGEMLPDNVLLCFALRRVCAATEWLASRFSNATQYQLIKAYPSAVGHNYLQLYHAFSGMPFWTKLIAYSEVGPNQAFTIDTGLMVVMCCYPQVACLAHRRQVGLWPQQPHLLAHQMQQWLL
eukprot:GHRR01028139.1.p1 GENE.GHRR01028139.1~~GHRR01028139.1.p1  ORF type:complete len:426 (+),score=198.99 GHRR01028139.1:52-1278(+)